MNGDQQQKQDQPAVEPGAAGPGGTSWARSTDYPNGSTSRMRADVLAALGVLKVATADQLQRITRPGLKSNKALRAALLDLGLHGLTLSEGRTTTRDKLWRLTPAGLDAAAEVLPAGRDLGGTARGAGRTGAPHSVMVNETIAAILAGGTAPDAGPGTGTITDWSTETVHEIGPRLRAITDAVLQAPDDGVPLLLVEVDRHNETPTELAAKFAGYWEFFHLTYKRPALPTDSTDWRARSSPGLLPLWRRQYPQADPATLPPIALVLTGAGRLGTDNLSVKVRDLTAAYWQPDRHDPFDFTDSIPIVVARLEDLQTHGPQGEIWWRYGNDTRQSLTDALAGREYTDRTRARLKAQDDAAQATKDRQAEEKAEASRCPTCRRRPDEYESHWQASDGTTDCSPCRDTKNAADDAQALKEAQARERCVTCQTGLIENNLLAYDPEAIECWDCYNKREFSTGEHLRRPEPPPKKRRLFRA
ncbi:replication-relaxation family protein [Kitasatospora sp. NBC_00240]|uniref:replication-relaxation family protein n=1 Tax=Kitasatospora sp. NBC_00240 TaxID=2903567 RepID=UPI0022504A3A|nr:replication-relaxation family protein [Kitasatospora sp. NBC_00240]MCX5216226.1 replication-relaxation family protein [Kitasatospora sp. NBC_00240]